MPPSFAAALLAGDPSARRFLDDGFRDADHRRARMEALAERRVDPTLLAEISRQNAALLPSPARHANLNALATKGTAVVVTGQQVGLFLGPLYTVYKAASAIAWARRLCEETGRRAVPLFWLQTEDHDYAEIDHVALPARGGGVTRLRLADELEDGERVPVAHRVLGSGITAVHARLDEALSDLPRASQILAMLVEHYRPSRRVADAFAGLLGALFADDGLLILDPRRAPIAALLSPLYRRALDEADEISALLSRRSEALTNAGFAPQVHVRPRAPLFFYHRPAPPRADAPEIEEGLRVEEVGPRYRIEPGAVPSEYQLIGGPGTLGRDDLERLIDDAPLRLSTSALLRPLAQDTLLPTVAYVGGPGEIAYFAQLAPLYEHMGVSMPMVVHRARFRLLDPRTRGRLGRSCLAPADVERPLDDLVVRLRGPGAGPDPKALEGALGEGFRAALSPHLPAIEALGPGLARATSRTLATVDRAVARYAARYRRDLVESDVAARSAASRLHDMLYPDGEPQERVHGLPWWAALAGIGALLDQIRGALDPLDPTPKDLLL